VSLSLDRERRMLAAFHAIDWSTIDPDALRRLLREYAGLALADQIDAAGIETGKLIRELGVRIGWKTAESRSLVTVVACIAGVARCLDGHRCQHAARGDRPLTAMLAARVIACDSCLLRFAGAIAASDRRAMNGDDRLCDFCLTEAVRFRPTVVHLGPCRVVGDMCTRCIGADTEGAA
jgi:hypothetical protein